eukprot:jgi/Chrzof1/9542/Cz04g07070.t1
MGTIRMSSYYRSTITSGLKEANLTVTGDDLPSASLGQSGVEYVPPTPPGVSPSPVIVPLAPLLADDVNATDLNATAYVNDTMKSNRTVGLNVTEKLNATAPTEQGTLPAANATAVTVTPTAPPTAARSGSTIRGASMVMAVGAAVVSIVFVL